jgi:hypothetical protein
MPYQDGRTTRRDLLQRKPKRKRALLFGVLTLGAGAVAGIAALVVATLALSLEALAKDFDVHGNAAAPVIAPSTLFPAVPPVHRVVNVYDPPASPLYQIPTRQNPRPNSGHDDAPEPGDDSPVAGGDN